MTCYMLKRMNLVVWSSRKLIHRGSTQSIFIESTSARAIGKGQQAIAGLPHIDTDWSVNKH
jgi:hypothetical protein